MLTMRIFMLYAHLRIHRKGWMWALFIALLEEELVTPFCVSCKIPIREHVHKPLT